MNARIKKSSEGNKRGNTIRPRKAYDSAFPPKDSNIKPPKKEDKKDK